MAAIGHENIAGVIDQDVLPDGTPYIVMEYVEGQTLRDLLTSDGAISLKLSATLAIDVLAALTAAHSKGVIHRDLKPENIRVTPSQRAKVLDFGVAKLLSSPSTSLSLEGAIIGTPHYMAPEQVMAGEIDGRADVYAVGVMLFECVTGRRPFDGESLVELLQRQVNAAPPWPHQFRPDVGAQLEALILKSLEKDRARRFDDAQQMREALEALLPTLSPGTSAAVTVPNHGGNVYTPTRRDERATPSPEQAVAAPVAADVPIRRGRLGLLGAFVGLATVSGAGVVAFQTWQTRQMPVSVQVAEPVVREPAPVAIAGKEVKTEENVEAPKPVVPAVRAPLPAPMAPMAATKLKVQAPVVAAPVTAPRVSGPSVASSASMTIRDGKVIVEQVEGMSLRELPIDFDPKNFDLLGYMPRARALAAARMPDAVMIAMDTMGVFADGHADLTLHPDYEARYFFRSPSRSVLNPQLPERDQEVVCLVNLRISAKQVRAMTVDSNYGCKERPLPPVRCSMADVMKKGAQAGALSERVSWVTFHNDDSWLIDQGDDREDRWYVRCPD